MTPPLPPAQRGRMYHERPCPTCDGYGQIKRHVCPGCLGFGVILREIPRDEPVPVFARMLYPHRYDDMTPEFTPEPASGGSDHDGG